MINDVFTATDQLRAARELVAQGWCQGTMARNAEGERVGTADDTACQWCLVGALRHAAVELLDEAIHQHGLQHAPSQGAPRRRVHEVANDAYRKSVRVVEESLALQDRSSIEDGVPSLPYWNDTKDRTQEDVLSLLDEAAKRAAEIDKPTSQ